tara:strand:+ start:109 stop:1482 length:1374 start_codon:yes stop_codon:yes gene_type:complete
MGRPSSDKWVMDKHYVLPNNESIYIYKRPRSSVWQYYLNIEGEGQERKSCLTKNKDDALKFALDRKLEVLSRQKQGLKARRVKKMFDFIDEFLEGEEKRIASHNVSGHITKETFRGKRYHLSRLKDFYHGKSIKLEDIDYSKLFNYPLWRSTIDPIWNKTVPKTNHSILGELTTIRAYFGYLLRKGYIGREPTFHKLKRESRRTHRRDYLTPRQYMQTVNTIRAWSNSTVPTPTQQYNRRMIYMALLIMSNSCLRKGELKGLRWYDLEPNTNLSKVDQKIGHIIRIRAEITKVGEPRVVQSPTVNRFEEIRKLAGIPRESKSPFPHVPPEYRGNYIFGKYNHYDQPLGVGTWNRLWQDIRELCADRYWNQKNITYYSFRHTGISFAVSRGVPMLQLSRNCGTGTRYIEDVYYHHESESQKMWETLQQNRRFHNKVDSHRDDLLLEMEDALSQIDMDE